MRFLEPSEFLPKVEAIFSDLKDKIKMALPNADVEHIGSSAIKGAISKGDLDVLVRVLPPNFEIAISKIKELGFAEKSGTLRTEQLCMLVTDVYNWDVAVQLIAKNSEFEDFVSFRDRLNDDPGLVLAYNQLKLSSRELSPENYRQKKSAFIEMVLRNENSNHKK
ncbi:GrpB family protein [Bdellovibrio sp. HCB288]|uniref:GrpB family protein n=1 Tax=Bdellovibrio sp. HCB288 TaxID=3394355 RepID=UPI0039B3C9D1